MNNIVMNTMAPYLAVGTNDYQSAQPEPSGCFSSVCAVVSPCRFYILLNPYSRARRWIVSSPWCSENWGLREVLWHAWGHTACEE